MNKPKNWQTERTGEQYKWNNKLNEQASELTEWKNELAKLQTYWATEWKERLKGINAWKEGIKRSDRTNWTNWATEMNKRVVLDEFNGRDERSNWMSIERWNWLIKRMNWMNELILFRAVKLPVILLKLILDNFSRPEVRRLNLPVRDVWTWKSWTTWLKLSIMNFRTRNTFSPPC